MVLMMLYIIIAVSFWYYPVRLDLFPFFFDCADKRAVRAIGINHRDIIRLSRFIQRHRLKKKTSFSFRYSACVA